MKLSELKKKRSGEMKEFHLTSNTNWAKCTPEVLGSLDYSTKA